MTLTRSAGLQRTQMRKRATVKLRMALRELAESREIVIARSGGRCECCGAPGTDVHHRRPRMSGGSTAVGMNAPSNLVMACRSCHTTFESYREIALAGGWLLSNLAHAERVAVRHHSLGWVQLLSDGSYEDATEASA